MSQGPWDHPSSGTYTRADLVERLRQEGWSVREAGRLVDDVLDTLVDTLATGEHVLISGFGRLQPKVRSGRPARNPRTGDPVQVEPHTTVVLEPSPRLRESLTRALGER